MGDRGNIVIEKDKEMFQHPVFFYTHGSGSQLKPVLQNALKRGKGRWSDGSYLARIIFCELTKGDTEGNTGYGISTAIGDSGAPLLCVNMGKQTVRELVSDDDIKSATKTSWSFEEFCDENLE